MVNKLFDQLKDCKFQVDKAKAHLCLKDTYNLWDMGLQLSFQLCGQKDRLHLAE